MLTIRLTKSVDVRPAKLAKRAGRTKSFYVQQAILRHLESLEDIYLAVRCLCLIRAGKEPTIPLAVVKRHAL